MTPERVQGPQANLHELPGSHSDPALIRRHTGDVTRHAPQEQW